MVEKKKYKKKGGGVVLIGGWDRGVSIQYAMSCHVVACFLWTLDGTG